MKMWTILLCAVCASSVGLCGCGDAVPSADEQAEMEAEMEADMEQMGMTLPQDPSENTVPAEPEVSE